MDSNNLQAIWKSYDDKMEKLLTVNKAIAVELTRQKMNKQISRLNRPKWLGINIGIPYTILIWTVAMTATLAQAYLVAIGFGAIGLIMTILLGHYFYQLHLIDQVSNSEDVLSTQKQLSKLRLSSIRSLNLSVIQLPFWSLCWVSIDAVVESPLLYGGVNLVVFLLLACLAWWLYQQLSDTSKPSRVGDYLLSGWEWEPIVKSAALLEQIEEYEQVAE